MPALDLYHRILIYLKGEFAEHQYTLEELQAYQFPPPSSVKILGDSVHSQAYVPSVDPFFKKHILNWIQVLPIQDKDAQWKDLAEAEKSIHDYFETALQLPVMQPYRQLAQEFAEKSRTDKLKFLVTEGMGAPFIRWQPESQQWRLDLTYLYQFEVRKNLLPYGARLILTADFEPVEIHLPYQVVENKIVPEAKDYDPEDPLAYHVLTATLMAHVTLYEHAVGCHLVQAGGMLSQFVQHQEALPEDLNRLIRPFLFRTGEINSAAQRLLISPGGILSRLFSLTPKALALYLEAGLDQYQVISPLQHYDERIPYFRDAEKVYRVIRTFIHQMIDEIFPEEIPAGVQEWISANSWAHYLIMEQNTPREQLEVLLTTHVFNVSMWHEQIGTMCWYLLDPRSIRVKPWLTHPEAELESEQNTIQGLFLALTTSVVTMPKLNDDLGQTHREEFRDIYQQFRDELNELVLECEHLDPDNLECSVSL